MYHLRDSKSTFGREDDTSYLSLLGPGTSRLISPMQVRPSGAEISADATVLFSLVARYRWCGDNRGTPDNPSVLHYKKKKKCVLSVAM